MRNVVIAGLIWSFAGTVSAAEYEYEIDLILRSEGSGGTTQRQSIDLETGRLKIEQDGAPDIRRDASEEDIMAITAFVQAQIAVIDLRPSGEVGFPQVEVQIEFETGGTDVELTQVYPADAVPGAVTTLQRVFFESVLD